MKVMTNWDSLIVYLASTSADSLVEKASKGKVQEHEMLDLLAMFEIAPTPYNQLRLMEEIEAAASKL